MPRFWTPVTSWMAAISLCCGRKTILVMERSVFPISRWFPLPCTPPTAVLHFGLRCCLWECCRLAACHYTPHSLTKNNEGTKGMGKTWILMLLRQAGVALAFIIYGQTNGRDTDRWTLLNYTVQNKTEKKNCGISNSHWYVNMKVHLIKCARRLQCNS